MSRKCASCGAVYGDDVSFCGVDGKVVIEEQSSADFDPRLGRQVGGYVLAARVADGAMGRVYQAFHPESHERVAIKILHEPVTHDAVAVERFRREYETAREMHHVHIVRAFDFGPTEDGSFYMVMEYLEGEPLSRLIERGPLALSQAVRIVCQIALALEHAHSFGFIHRDLKPDNVFLCRAAGGPMVRVLDFGSVKLQVEIGAKLTAIGTTLGSPFYMSPEQASGALDVDQRTDVFALGAMTYEMLTGKIAFHDIAVARILLKIMNEDPAPVRSLRPELPAIVDDVLSQAVHKKKERRFISSLAFAARLMEGLGLSGEVSGWAEGTEADLEHALAGATPEVPRPFGAPAPATASPEHALLSSSPPSSSPPPGVHGPGKLVRALMAAFALALVAAIFYFAV